MRLGEIERAERDLERGVFVLADTKNGSPRIVPMHPRLRVLAGYKLHRGFRADFDAARAAVGMPWLHFHDLRHSAASELLAQGVDLYTIGGIFGHKSSASTKRYAHLALGAMVDAVGKMGRK